MKKQILGFLSIFLLCPGLVQAEEAIRFFDVEYVVNQDTSLSVREKLNYYTTEEKHGIFRYIPEKYNDRGRSPVIWEGVTIDGGESHPYEVSQRGGKSLAQIGDPDEVFSGERQYELNYRVDFAVAKWDGQDELYWDIVGEDWTFPIEEVTATVRSPFAAIQAAECYAGEFGGDNNLCQVEMVDAQTVKIIYAWRMAQGENVTLWLQFAPENQLIFPGWWEQNRWWLLPVILGAIGVLMMTILLMGFSWWTREEIYVNEGTLTLTPSGPTKKKPFFYRQPKAFWYEPFKNITPAQAGFLLTGQFKSAHLVAEILWLMSEKYLLIKKGEKGWLKGQDYDFVKLREADEGLKEYQRLILEGLFERGEETALSKLKKHFFRQMPQIRSAMAKSLMDEGYLMKSWKGAVLQRRSALGNHYKYLVAGLKENLKYGKWRTEVQEKQLYVEEVLPFAVALEEAEKLAQDMRELGLDQTASEGARMSDLALVALLNDGFVESFSHDFNSTYAQMTSSGGGGGGGGGYSGGGGGGGGGGSW